MQSNDHNLNNPTQIDTLNLSNMEDNTLDYVSYRSIPQIFYDHLKMKDPTLFIISDSVDDVAYLGDMRIDINKQVEMPYMSYDPESKEYVISIYLKTKNNKYLIIPLFRFKNADHALEVLKSKSMLHDKTAIKKNIVKLLIEYKLGNIGMNDLIIGIIKELIKNPSNPEFNKLIEFCNSKLPQSISIANNRDIPLELKVGISDKYYHERIPLVKLYSDVYDTLIRNCVVSECIHNDLYNVDLLESMSIMSIIADDIMNINVPK